MIAGGRHDIEDRFTDTVLAQNTIDDLGGTAPPIFHLQARLRLKSLLERVGGESFHRGVDNDFAAFFFGGFHQFRALSEGR